MLLEGAQRFSVIFVLRLGVGIHHPGDAAMVIWLAYKGYPPALPGDTYYREGYRSGYRGKKRGNSMKRIM